MPELREVCKKSHLFDRNDSLSGKRNVLYKHRAISALLGVPGVVWLLNETTIDAGRCGMKRTLLAELGRIKNVDELRAVARE